MKMLIIEDDRLLAESIADYLEENFSVDLAGDGEEGLYEAEKDIYDLILLLNYFDLYFYQLDFQFFQ